MVLFDPGEELAADLDDGLDPQWVASVGQAGPLRSSYSAEAG